jgi:hypothetical protein
MPTYNCDACIFSSKIKTHFIRHLNTPKHHKINLVHNTPTEGKNKKSINFDPNLTIFDHYGEKNDPNLTIFDPNLTIFDPNLTKNPKIDKKTKKNENRHRFICELCKKSLSTKGHLKRHLKNNCPKMKSHHDSEVSKVEKKVIESKNETEIFKDLLQEQTVLFHEERKDLYSQMEKLLDKVGHTTNIQSNIKNTINLNSYGNEDLSHITDILKNELIKIPYEMIPKMIEAVHFNDEKPENKNISLSNIRDNKVKIYSEKGWVYKDKIETINDLVEGKYFILENFYEKNTNEIDNKTNYIKFREFFNAEDKELVSTLKKKCELVLFNNRENKN